MGTPDYYTTYALVFSTVLVTIMRLWHPFTCKPQIFTAQIWSQGVDDFLVPKDILAHWNDVFGEDEFKVNVHVNETLALVDIDLYQWMHLRQRERHQLLISRCRRPGDEAKEGDRMKTMGETKVQIHHLFAADKLGDTAGEEVACLKTVKIPANTMLTCS